jgi:hemerythrin superfamily protein
MPRNNTSTRNTAKKSTAGAAKTAARKTAGGAKKAASAARKTAGGAKKAAGTARKSATATKSRASSTARSRQPDALQVLIDDHRTVEELFKKFEAAGSRANKTRQDVARKVIEELSAHAVIEEQAFYPAVRAMVEDAEDVVLESLEEHHVVKWVLSELEKMTPEDERFEAKMSVLMENVRHHVKEEEKDMFPKVRRTLSREQLQALGEALVGAKASAPRRPHPRQPDTPPGNMIAGALSAPIDAALQAGQNAVNEVRKLANRGR